MKVTMKEIAKPIYNEWETKYWNEFSKRKK